MSVTGILGKKIGMTQVFDEKGDVHPITVLQAGPCVITQLKTAAKDGYEAAQIGLVEFVKVSRVTKPLAGHFAKHDLPPVKEIREVGLEAAAEGEENVKGADHIDKLLALEEVNEDAIASLNILFTFGGCFETDFANLLDRRQVVLGEVASQRL